MFVRYAVLHLCFQHNNLLSRVYCTVSSLYVNKDFTDRLVLNKANGTNSMANISVIGLTGFRMMLHRWEHSQESGLFTLADCLNLI